MSVRIIFKKVKQEVTAIFPQLSKVTLSQPEWENTEHRKTTRHYASYHVGEYKITYAKALERKNSKTVEAMLFHEFGHAIDDLFGEFKPEKVALKPFLKDLQNIDHEDKGDEAIANYYVWKFFGRRIKYDPKTQLQKF